MRKSWPLVLFCLLAAGCAKSDGDKARDAAKPLPSGGGAPTRGADVKRDGFVGVIQAATLDRLKSQTIGAAFAKYKYFGERNWTESRLKNGNDMVDFYG